MLLDLPDHDSVRLEHRLEVDRLVELVDVLVWVLDPEKYADAAVHDRYLAPLAGHAGVLLVVLNQVDRLDAAAARRPAWPTCAGCWTARGSPARRCWRRPRRTGAGLAELRGSWPTGWPPGARRPQRLDADLDGPRRRCGRPARRRRRPECAGRQPATRWSTRSPTAAGVPAVAAAVDRAHRRQGRRAPAGRSCAGLRQLRPDPLRRLQLPATPSEACGRRCRGRPRCSGRGWTARCAS